MILSRRHYRIRGPSPFLSVSGGRSALRTTKLLKDTADLDQTTIVRVPARVITIDMSLHARPYTIWKQRLLASVKLHKTAETVTKTVGRNRNDGVCVFDGKASLMASGVESGTMNPYL